MAISGRLLLTLAVATGLTACGDSDTVAEKAIEKYAEQQGVDLDVDVKDGGQSITWKSEQDGVTAQFGGDVKVPDGFPRDVPVYPGISLQAASATPDGFLIYGQSGDSAQQVADFYVDRMVADGWTKESEASQENVMRMLTFTKEGRNAAVNVITGDGGTTVQITATKGG
jgi:hypothetical protein